MLCTESGVYEADLLIEGGVIREIGTGLSDAEAEVVEAKGKYVLPGAVDIHTHMDLDVGIARVIDDFTPELLRLPAAALPPLWIIWPLDRRIAACGTRLRNITGWRMEMPW